MLSLLFYLIIILVLAAILFLFYYKRQLIKNYRPKKHPHLVNLDSLTVSSVSQAKQSKQTDKSLDTQEQSPYNPNIVVLQLSAFPGRPYMGYELHQALLTAGLRLGENNIFHRCADDDNNKILFSLAAATSHGSFAIEDMGSFKCNGLLLFMQLDPKQKLMANFDLMLDIARQLTDEMGGDIYDDLSQAINADVIKRLREKICLVETSNLYAADLLDNLD